MDRRRNKPKFWGYMAHEVEVDGQPGLCFSDGQLQIMSKEEFEDMVELARRFYETEGIEAYIKKENDANRWAGHPVLGTEMVDGKYVLPDLIVDRREFRKNLQRNWGFNCSWCNTKVSSKTDTEYYWINESLSRGKTISGQCCSEACADNLWYDLIIQWILEEKLTDIFHTDKTIKATS